MFRLLGGFALLFVLVGLVFWRRRAKCRLRQNTYPHHIEMTQEEAQFERDCEEFSDVLCYRVCQTFPQPSEIPEVKVGDVRKRYE